MINAEEYSELIRKRTEQVVSETREAIEAVYNELNNGQRKKLLKNKTIYDLFVRYGVNFDK